MDEKSKDESWEQEPSVQAVRKGKEAILELIGDDVSRIVMSFAGHDYSLLPIAVCEGNKDIVQFLLDRGASVHLEGRDHWSLHLAAVEGHEEILKLLIQHQKTRTPYARLDFNKDFKDSSGKTLLHSAVTRNINIVKYLLDLGADMNATDDCKRCVLLTAMRAEQVEIVKLLLERGCEVDWPDTKYNGLLHEAAKIGNKAVLKLLLDHGELDVNDQNIDKQNALHFACQRGNEDVVKFLIERGAQVNIKNLQGWTVLHIASERGFNQVVEILVENGADIDATTTGMGRTSLWLSCIRGRESTVQLLLELGASIEVNNRNNRNVVEQLLDEYDKLPAEILVRLIVRMKSQKLPVSSKIFEVIEKNNKMRAYKVKCVQELESMRSDDSKLAFWRLLMSNNRCLAGFARNEELIKVLKSDECEIKFPIYSSLLKNQMIRGIFRKMLLDKVQYFFKAVSESEGNEHLPKLPILCVHEIFSYFSNSDIKNLIKVCDPHNDFDFKMKEKL